MARLPRYFIDGQPQHIIQRGNNREAIFADEADYRRYVASLEDAINRFGCAIHAYVLMTNHVHLLVTPEAKHRLPKTLQSVGRRYVQYCNDPYGRTGTLWEGRYRATVIDDEHYLLSCMRYIELNPVRAGMVSHPGEYPWPSFRGHAYGEDDALVRDHALYRQLGRRARARHVAYRQLFKAQLPQADVDAMRDATNTAWVLGHDHFREKIEALSQRRATPRPRGRPRQDESIESDPIYPLTPFTPIYPMDRIAWHDPRHKGPKALLAGETLEGNQRARELPPSRLLWYCTVSPKEPFKIPIPQFLSTKGTFDEHH